MNNQTTFSKAVVEVSKLVSTLRRKRLRGAPLFSSIDATASCIYASIILYVS
jgi:hypothetical protein